MRNIWTIAKKEYDHYFITPIAYIVAAVILLVLGFLFTAIIRSAAQQAAFGGGFAPDITIVNWWFAFLLMFGTPALTMRLLADETKTGTLELLLTSPIRDHELVIGKWLGSLLFILTIILFSLLYPVVLNRYVTPGIDWQLVLSSYLGVLLVGASFLALGVGISAVFSNQVAAFFVALIVCLGLFFLIGIPAQLIQAGTGSEVFQYLVMSTHFDDAFNVGKVSLSNIIYFVSLIALGLFTGTVAVESRRWN